MKINFKAELAKILGSICNLDYQKIYSLIEKPPDITFGDLSFPCFSLIVSEENNKVRFLLRKNRVLLQNNKFPAKGKVLLEKYQKKPKDIAEELKEKLLDIISQEQVNQYFSKVEVRGSYLNVFINKTLYIKNVLENFENSLQCEKQTQKVIIEYMNANPNKPLHLGQARNICIGDSLVQVFRFLGHNVHAVNYGDDSGNNVACNLIAHLNYKIPWKKKGLKFDHYCGQVYTDSLSYKEEDPEFAKKLEFVLKEIENKESKIAQQQRKYATECMLAQMTTCWRMNSYFNLNNWETDILHLDLLADTLKQIKKIKQVKFIKQGKYKNCLVFDLLGIEKFAGMKDKICVLIKSDGVATYLAKDIAYALWKLGYLKKTFYYKSLVQQPNDDFLYSTTSEIQKNDKQDKLNFGNYDLSIVVIDKRQEFLQEVLVEILNQLAQSKIIDQKIIKRQKQYFHLSYGVVYLTPETLIDCGYSLTAEEKKQKRLAFSSRKGWTVTIDEVLDSLEKRAYQETKERNPDESEVWLKQTSQKIAVAALRFWLSKTDKKRDLVFDIKESLKLNGASGAYIQYSYVRIVNILKKIEKQGVFIKDFGIEKNLINKDYSSIINYELLKHLKEFELVKKIDSFEDIIKKTKIEMSLHFLCNYLLELCQIFNQFYEQCPVIKNKEDIKLARIELIKKVSIILKIGLNLLGIEELEKM